MVVAKAIIKPDTSLKQLVIIAGAAAKMRMAASITETHAMGATLSKPLRDVALAWVMRLVPKSQMQRLVTRAVSMTILAGI